MPSLNETQRKAVAADDRPTLVLAGAGTGKTRVIVERIVWLIEERGVHGGNILALTFTNRAAGEMRARVAQRLGVDRLATWLGTFHAFAVYILRREADAIGRSKDFTIFDDTDQLSLVKRLIKELPPDYEHVSPRETLRWISGYKQTLETPGQPDLLDSAEERTYKRLWGLYNDALIRTGAFDFDDLLVYLARLLQENQAVREKYQRRFRYVLVDEYQDTNRVQYVIAKCLAGEGGRLFVVGDEDQSVYSWRGADIRNVLDFQRDFPGAQVFRLEQNYRSTPQILAVANAVVSNNTERLGKTLFSKQDAGAPVRLYLADDAEDETRFIAEDIADHNLPPREVAILYRTNGQARLVEEALRRKGFAYVVVGGVRFYSRKEVKDLLCYLRVLTNPADDEAVRRIVNVPPRGIGAATMGQVQQYAADRNQHLLEVMHEVEHDQAFSGRARNAIGEFVHLIDDLVLAARDTDLAGLVEAILEKTKYREHVRESDERDLRARLEVVDEFVASCRQFDDRDAGGPAEFLQELSLYSEADNYDENTPAITLMTCHSAKGLEFDYVYLIGMEEGLLPHATALEDEAEMEEERRLCYVAMTRARKRLTLTAAKFRVVYDDARERKPSRFLDEIPAECLETSSQPEPEPVRMHRPSRRVPGVPGPAGAARRKAPAAQQAAPAVESGERTIKMGARVFHPSFGKGSVLYTQGGGKTLRARIRFDTGRVGTFMVSKTPLQLLEGKAR